MRMLVERGYKSHHHTVGGLSRKRKANTEKLHYRYYAKEHLAT